MQFNAMQRIIMKQKNQNQKKRVIPFYAIKKSFTYIVCRFLPNFNIQILQLSKIQEIRESTYTSSDIDIDINHFVTLSRT
uniref:Uncharacterized protein n=1 Tax=Caenorhabditis japonica TaxID=281687 RepID=A0A8R1IIY4_CAEJA